MQIFGTAHVGDGRIDTGHDDLRSLVQSQEQRRELTRLSAVLTTPRQGCNHGRTVMDNIIYLVGLVVVIMAILSFFGLR